MMPRVRDERRLKTKDIGRLPPGVHEDGGGLRLIVEVTGSRRWAVRVTIAGKRYSRGLGPYPLITLDEARDQAVDIRRAARKGQDVTRQADKAVTFRQAFDTVFELRRQKLSNAKHLYQWQATMETFVFPRIGDQPTSETTHADVLAILTPIWFEKPETARRLLQRMELVFKSAILRGHRLAASPCIGIAEELGKQRDVVEHHRALPHGEVPAFIRTLRACGSDPITKLAFEWLILTATRSGETRGATKHELQGTQWVIPKERMKARQEHVVPLSARCLEMARQVIDLNRSSSLLFPGRTGKALSDMTFTKLLRDIGLADRATAHGFRSSFRDWCTEVDHTREVVAEAALAHLVRDKTEAAYRRSTYLEERQALMQRWADFSTATKP
jgi:integrase